MEDFVLSEYHGTGKTVIRYKSKIPWYDYGTVKISVKARYPIVRESRINLRYHHYTLGHCHAIPYS